MSVSKGYYNRAAKPGFCTQRDNLSGTNRPGVAMYELRRDVVRRAERTIRATIEGSADYHPRDATLDEVVPVSNGCRGCAVNWTDGNFAGNSQDRQNMNDFDYLE